MADIVEEFKNLDPARRAIAVKIIDTAKKNGVDPDLALAVAWQESKFNNVINPDSGAIGIMQVMPANSKGLGIEEKELHDPDTNILSGVRILKENLDRFKNKRAALVAYNASPTTAIKYMDSKESFDMLPDETKNYLESIHAMYPLSAMDADLDLPDVEAIGSFERPKASAISATIFPESGQEEPSWISQHPALGGAGAGATIGIGEKLYKYGKDIGAKEMLDPEIQKFIDKEMGSTSGEKWASKIGGPGGQTVKDAVRNYHLEKNLVGGETLRPSSIILPPGAEQRLEDELTAGQRLSSKLKKKVPFYEKGVEAGKILTKGASKVMSKLAPASTALTGLGTGISIEELIDRAQRGDIKGATIAGGTALTNALATQPFFPQLRGIGAIGSIPFDIADFAYDPENYSVVKESLKREDKKKKGGLA
jgi:hypothetical protein